MKFQQDNAKIHVSRSTERWFEAQNIPLLDWPNRFPDLNPMENLWAILARRVYANNKQYETVQELKDAITTVFAELDQEVIDNPVRSMPNRIYQLINRNGGLTDY
uniref:Tc1-like transposase DDE domain-containing protein n=1 Tax=Acrobeloides nanus TaxID=290746 RepID=A0A914DE07_9BILA